MSGRRWSVGDWKWSVGDLKCSVSDRKWSVCNQKLSVGDQKWTASRSGQYKLTRRNKRETISGLPYGLRMPVRGHTVGYRKGSVNKQMWSMGELWWSVSEWWWLISDRNWSVTDRNGSAIYIILSSYLTPLVYKKCKRMSLCWCEQCFH